MRSFFLGVLMCIVSLPASGEDGFAVRDGDTVVFLGDSITAARTYGKLIENYTLLRFPGRKVRFYNAGIGGDTATGGLKRLDRDVFSRGATVLTVAYGVNDIGWGVRADEAHKQAHLDAIRGIVEACQKQNVRAYICSPAITSEDPDKAEVGFLQKMCDEAHAVARSMGASVIDVQRSMREVQRRVIAANASIADEAKHTKLHAADGVHLNELGQLAMAAAILKGLGAPAEVSSAVIDAEEPQVVEAKGCRVTDVAKVNDGVEFTRLDEGLPLNQGLFFALNFRFVPLHQDLNRYLLTVRGLPAGRYAVSADGRNIATYTASQLAAGVNIASMTASAWQPGGPWDAQAHVLKTLTDARHDLGTSELLAELYLPGGALAEPLSAPAADADLQLVELQRLVGKPRPYRFTVRVAAEAHKT